MTLRALAGREPAVSGIGLAAMDRTVRDEAGDTIRRAMDLGITLIDLGEVPAPGIGARRLRPPGAGDDVVIAARAASTERDGRPEAVRRAVERSLRALTTERIDLYLQDGGDPRVPVRETFGALGELVAEGKVGYLGIRKAPAAAVRHAHSVAPLAAVEAEYSIAVRDVETNGILATARELGVRLIASSPLRGGLLCGGAGAIERMTADHRGRAWVREARDAMEGDVRTIEALGAVADRYGASCAQLALAWLLAQGDDIVPVPATRRPLHLVENYAAQWLPLDAAAESMIRRSVPAIAAGPRGHGPMPG